MPALLLITYTYFFLPQSRPCFSIDHFVKEKVDIKSESQGVLNLCSVFRQLVLQLLSGFSTSLGPGWGWWGNASIFVPDKSLFLEMFRLL